jgi:hypothetical protein
LLHQRDDLCLIGGGQLRQGEVDRPHGAFAEVRLVAEASIAYLVLNFCALWKKQTILPSYRWWGGGCRIMVRAGL